MSDLEAKTRRPRARPPRLLEGSRLLAARILLVALRASAGRAGVAVVYHELATGEAAASGLPPALDTSLFAEQVRHLRRSYRVVPASELLDAVRARRRGGRFPAALTFDDDLASHVRYALPELAETGTRATFFLCGASLERPFSFWWERLGRAVERDGWAAVDSALEAAGAPAGSRDGRDVLRTVEALDPARRGRFAEELGRLAPDPSDAGLRADQVGLLVAGGHELGFHTRAHQPLQQLDAEGLSAALVDGAGQLAEIAGSPLTVIAYPHGRADPRVADAARSAGYACGFTGRAEAVTAASDPLLLGRVQPSRASCGAFALWLVRVLLRASHTKSRFD